MPRSSACEHERGGGGCSRDPEEGFAARKQTAPAADRLQADDVYKLFSGRLNSHETEITKPPKKLRDNNENIGHFELSGFDGGSSAALEANLMKQFDVMEKKLQRKYPQAPSHPSVRPGGLATVSGAGILVNGGFPQDMPKAWILPAFAKVIRPKLARRFDFSAWEAFCPYLLSLAFVSYVRPRHSLRARHFPPGGISGSGSSSMARSFPCGPPPCRRCGGRRIVRGDWCGSRSSSSPNSTTALRLRRHTS